MELETRKVQKLGYSSVGISLPKGWAQSNGLKPGSLVAIAVEDDGTLRIKAGPLEEIQAASEAVSGIIAAGIVPAALEMMDRLIVAAVEAAYHAGLPTDAGAVLLVEVDGPAAGLDAHAAAVRRVCMARGAREVRTARDEAERAALWKCRKRAFGAVGRLAPNYCTQDGVVPRTRVPDILRRIAAEFPAWQPEQGLCGRCLETYEAAFGHELASAA